MPKDKNLLIALGIVSLLVMIGYIKIEYIQNVSNEVTRCIDTRILASSEAIASLDAQTTNRQRICETNNPILQEYKSCIQRVYDTNLMGWWVESALWINNILTGAKLDVDKTIHTHNKSCMNYQEYRVVPFTDKDRFLTPEE